MIETLTHYPTPEELGYLPFNGIKRHLRQEWYTPWVAVETVKNILNKEGEPMIEEFGRSPLPTEYGDWTYIVFGDKTTGQHHELLLFGNITEPGQTGDDLLVRVHSSCKTNEVYHAINCECRYEKTI